MGITEPAGRTRPAAEEDARARRINLQITPGGRKAEVNVRARDGEEASPNAQDVKLELQEALEQVSGIESRLEQDPFLDTELSS